MGNPVRESASNWQLFLDWCTAAGASSLPADRATITAFLTELPAGRSTRLARIAAIRRAHASAGLADPYPTCPIDLSPDPVLPEILGAVTVRGWPMGVTGRRDGFLLVLYAGLHLTRRRIRALVAADIAAGVGWASIAGRSVVRTASPGDCPVCAITRWLRVLGIAERSGWWAVKSQMAGQFPEPADAADAHDCDRPVGAGWRRAELLLPAIDRYGFMDGEAPLTVRSISTLSIRRRALAQEPAAEPSELTLPVVALPAAEPEPSSWTLRSTKDALAELDPLLDRLDAEIDAALARTKALFTDLSE